MLQKDRGITPHSVIRTKNKDGSVTTSEVYSFENWSNLKFLDFMMWIGIILLLVGIVGPIASLLLLLFYCWDIDKESIPFNFFGIIISAYLLLDYHHQWILSRITAYFYKGDKLIYIAYLNGAMLLAHSILLYYGNSLFEYSQKNKLALFGYVVTISAGCFLLAAIVFKTGIININPIVQNENVTTQTTKQSENADNNNSTPVTEDNGTIPIDTTNNESYSQNNNIISIDVPEDKRSVINDFINATNNRNFDRLIGYYAPVIRREWSMYNPTISQIQHVTYHLWEVTSSSVQTIQSMGMVNDSTIKADITNVYITRKKGLTKQKHYDTFFILNSDNQIVETYGYEKN